jgi:DNA-binding NarL/FixJ family response regulator
MRTTSIADCVVKAIVAVKRGEVWLERKTLADALAALIAELDMGSATHAKSGEVNCRRRLSLTGRESEIVELLSHGLTNKEIARTLEVSTETVKKHLQNIFIKLGVHRRTQVVRSQLSGG